MSLSTSALAQPATDSAAASETASPEREAAERALIEAETEKTRAEATKAKREGSKGWQWLSTLGPILTALTAVIGAFVTARKVGLDRKDAFAREANARADAEKNSETTRFDERFTKAVAGLSSEKPGEQSGAAVLVSSMVREKRASLSDQALELLIVSLQTKHDPACERLLRLALQRFARQAPERLLDRLAYLQTSDLNFANLELPGLDIAFSHLPKAEFQNSKLPNCRAYEAKLKGANFQGADLREAEWVRVTADETDFDRAVMTDANLRDASLKLADFYRADLRGANLRETWLTGTKFHRAALAGAVFHKARLDDKALRSILVTEDWEEALFDRPVRDRLRELAEE